MTWQNKSLYKGWQLSPLADGASKNANWEFPHYFLTSSELLRHD